MMPYRLLIAALFLLLPLAPALAGLPVRSDDPVVSAELCLDAAKRAERQTGMPDGLISSIMLAETGRWNKARRRSYPWPWTITSGTENWFAADRQEAIGVVRRLQAEGRQNIDVGCMQINLHWHPDAFRTLEEAFDPTHNITYGAAFLSELQAELGSWSRAVAAYHSRDPDRGAAYLARVEQLQEKQRYWSKDELQTAFAEVRREDPAGPAWRFPLERAVLRANQRTGVLLAALAAPDGVPLQPSAGSIVPLRRDGGAGRPIIGGPQAGSSRPPP